MPPFAAPAALFLRGLRAYPQGVVWLARHPGYLGLLLIPSLVSLASAAVALTWFFTHTATWSAWLPFLGGDGAWARIARLLVEVGAVVFVLVAAVLLMKVAAAPVYERISLAVERDATGREPPQPTLLGSLRLVLVEAQKAVLIFAISSLLLCIPGLNVLSVLSAAFLVGWDFFDEPLARRGWTLGRRLGLVARGEFWAVLGFGLWLVIPFAQILMAPLAVAGGTLLSLDALKRHGQLLTP